jgi:Zn finger protein HypA/HybF involved in hydrogenase expression
MNIFEQKACLLCRKYFYKNALQYKLCDSCRGKIYEIIEFFLLFIFLVILLELLSIFIGYFI